MGGGSCLLLGERRKLGGVQGALSRAALVAPAGAKRPCCWGAVRGGGTTLGGTTTPPRVVPCSKNAFMPQIIVPQGIAGVFIGVFFFLEHE